MGLLKDNGVDPSYYSQIAQAESGNNPLARNPVKGQTASGLYQFTAGTWKGMVDKLGLNYSLDDRFDPRKAKVVMEAFTKENSKYLQNKLGKTPTNTDLYFGHFLGAGSAAPFLKNVQTNPHGIARMDSSVLNANRNVFFDKSGQRRSNIEVYNEMAKRLGQKPTVTSTSKPMQQYANITPNLTNLDISSISDNLEAENQETATQKPNEVARAEEVVDTKSKEINALKELQAKMFQQPEQQQQIEPQQQQSQETPYRDILSDYASTEAFVESGLPEMRSGGYSNDHTEQGFFQGNPLHLQKLGGHVTEGFWETDPMIVSREGGYMQDNNILVSYQQGGEGFFEAGNLMVLEQGGYSQHVEKGFFVSNSYNNFQEGGQFSELMNERRLKNLPIDSQGVWKYPKQEVLIPTDGNITMKNVDYPILGTSLETGQQQLMMPNMDYFFKNTNTVHELPIIKK